MPSQRSEEEFFKALEEAEVELPSLGGFPRMSGFARLTPIEIDHQSTPSAAEPSSEFVQRSAFRVHTVVVAQDGSGDYETINEALKNLPSSGGSIFVKEGTYTISSTINITKDNVSLIGTGRATKFDLVTNSINCFRVNGPDYFTLENIFINFNGSGEGLYGVYISNSEGASIKNCWIEGDFASSIKIDGSQNEIIISNNFFSGSLETSIDLANTSRVTVFGNILKNPFNCNSVTEFTITNNIVINNVDDVDGIALTSCTDGVVSNNFLEDDAAGEGGITLFSNTSRIVVNGNRVRDFATGVNVKFGTCDRNLIDSNILVNNTAGINDAGTNTLIGDNITA